MPNNSWGMPDEEYTAMREKSQQERELSKQAGEMAKTLAIDILKQCQCKGFTEKQVEVLADRLKWEIEHTLSEVQGGRKFAFKAQTEGR